MAARLLCLMFLLACLVHARSPRHLQPRRLPAKNMAVLAKFTEVGSSLGLGDKIHLFVNRQGSQNAAENQVATAEAAQARDKSGGGENVKSADGDPWWLKDLPWWMPPPPEWGPLPPTMYTAYYHGTNGAPLATPNYYPLFRRIEDLEPPLGHVSPLPSKGEGDNFRPAEDMQSPENVNPLQSNPSPTVPVPNAEFIDHLISPQIIPLGQEVLFDPGHHYRKYWEKRNSKEAFSFKSIPQYPPDAGNMLRERWQSRSKPDYWKRTLWQRKAYYPSEFEQPTEYQNARRLSVAQQEQPM